MWGCLCGATDCPSCGPAQGYYPDDDEFDLDDDTDTSDAGTMPPLPKEQQ